MLKILIDGSEKLAGRGHQHTGWHPADILGPDSPLLPAAPARRVALYVDAAGGPAAGCLAAYVKDLGDQVAWADFRRFEGAYHAPTIQPNPDGGDWRIGGIGIAPPAFDAAQYRAEVLRASTERAWEAEPGRPRCCWMSTSAPTPGLWAAPGTWAGQNRTPRPPACSRSPSGTTTVITDSSPAWRPKLARRNNEPGRWPAS